MNRVKNIIVLSCILSLTLFAEPSVYGFTDTKRIKYEQNIEKKIVSLQQKVMRQEEKIEGLNSLVEGLIGSINDLKHAKNSKKGVSVSSSKMRRLETKIGKIERNYVTKEEFLAKLKQQTKVIKTTPKVSSTVPKKSSKKSTTATLFHQGVKLFVKRRFSEAKKRFLVTDEKGYKTASSNYYLGEIAYYSKDYENAIFFFQKSAGINDETSYIPTLLLHTAISLEKTGKKAKAKIFYENVIMRFEGQKVANMAKDKLKKL